MSALKPRFPMSLCAVTWRFEIVPLFWTGAAFVPSPLSPFPFLWTKLVSGSSPRSSAPGVAVVGNGVPSRIARTAGMASTSRRITSPLTHHLRSVSTPAKPKGHHDTRARRERHRRSLDHETSETAGRVPHHHVDSQTKFIRVAGQRCGRYAASRRNELPPMRRQGATAEVADPLRDRWLVRPPKRRRTVATGETPPRSAAV